MSLCINRQCTTRDLRYKKRQSEQLPWKFNSLFQCDLDMLDNLCHGEQQNGNCLQISKVLIISNVLKYYFKFLLMSMLCTDNFMTGFLYHNFQFFSDIIKTWLHYAQKKMRAARTTKGSLYNGKKICSQKSYFWSNFICLLHLRMLLVNAPAHL